MSSTSAPPAPVAAMPVSRVSSRAMLAAIGQRRRDADRAEADVLTLAALYAAQHPVATLDDDVHGEMNSDRLDPTEAAGVAEEAVAALGAVLDVPYGTAGQLLADAVELTHRLPRLWTLVQAGRLSPWKARMVAAATTGVCDAAADQVDRQVAATGARNRIPGPGPLRALVHDALWSHDPDLAEGREQAAFEHRGVWVDHTDATSTGTSRLSAVLDTADALDLDTTIGDLAVELGRLGDPSPLDTRRARALGALAHPQRTLELFGTPHTDATTTCDDAAARPTGGWNRTITHLYAHINLADLALLGDRASGTVERLGPITGTLLRDWLTRSTRITVRPVLHYDDGPSGDKAIRPVDRHDPPQLMREAVILRDRHCVFPGCGIGARGCDLDHIDPYCDPDDGGPPGQTSLTNLAALCRRHHRLKTHTSWTYYRATDASYHWTSPDGSHFTVPPG